MRWAYELVHHAYLVCQTLGLIIILHARSVCLQLSELYSRELLDEYLSRALGVELEDKKLTSIDESAYVLTLDYTIKMLNIHERSVSVTQYNFML